MPIKAVIFDFDGVILETEGPIHQSWEELYQEFGLKLSMEVWASYIGTAENSFDPLDGIELSSAGCMIEKVWLFAEGSARTSWFWRKLFYLESTISSRTHDVLACR